MATVYVARDIKLDRIIALKVMQAHLAQDDDFVRRFIGEAKAAAALSHPCIVAVYDQGTDGQHVFLAMEHVPGRTLRDLLAARGRLGPRQALEIMRPVLAALGAAHRAGLVHRDVKPENVLLTDDGQVKVADFGLARAESASKQTKTGLIIGTVAYLAPEQVLSGHADVRSDVYAAGVMLFELLTGDQPHVGDTPLAVAYKHVNEVVPPPSSRVPGLPQQLDMLVTMATGHDPGRRPSDADRFLAVMNDVYRSLPDDIDARFDEAIRNATSVLAAPPAPAASGTRVYQRGIPPDEEPRRTLMDRLIDTFTGRSVLIAIGALAVVILGWAVWYQTSGQFDTVPRDIIGMKLEDARQRLGKDGIRVAVAEGVFSDKVKKGQVAMASPGPGEKISDGETVTLTPSKGRTPIPVPDVKGRSLDDARKALRDEGFTPGDVTQESSQTVPKSQVIRTDPPGGENRSPDDPVALVVSTGMSMPNLVGKNGAAAQNQLRSMGLQVKVEEQDDGGRPRGTVLAQDPPPGTGVSSGDSVTLRVNKADCGFFGDLNPFCDRGDEGGEGDNDELPVPNTLGRPVDEARRILQSAGFEVDVKSRFGSGRVLRQDPGTGTVKRGDKIKIFE